MGKDLFELLGVRVSVTGVYSGLSVIVLLLFMTWWLLNRKKRTGEPVFAGQVMNGIGFGLLPALSFLMCFLDIGYGKGAEVTAPFPQTGWLCEEGCYRPMRIEAVCVLLLFILLCAWLIIRKEEFPDNGDLLMTSVCLWSAVRLGTEDFRLEPNLPVHYACSAAVLLCLLVWTLRREKAYRLTLRAIADLAAVTVCLVLNILTVNGILSAGSGIADFAVKMGSAILAVILTLIAGGDVRKMKQKAVQGT